MSCFFKNTFICGLGLCFCLLISTAFSSEVPWWISEQVPGSFADNLFVKTQHLSCGKTDIVVTTTCVQRVDNLAYCFNQNISFLKKKGNIVRNANYNAPFSLPGGGDQPLIMEVFCVPLKNKFYLDVGSTNFGSCSICEWSDYFSEDGIYLGSTPGQYPRTNFKYRKVSKKFFNAILSVEKKSPELEGISISRVNEEPILKDSNDSNK